MSLFSLIKKSLSMNVNIQEAWSLWDILSAKYQFREKLHIWYNFAHDAALKLQLNAIDDKIKRVIKIVEDSCRKYSLPGPEVGVKAVNTSMNTEVLRDELIAQDVLIWLQGITELMLRAIRTTTTNDHLRHDFIRISNINLSMLDSAISFLRNNGWINPPPRYPNIPQEVDENIDLSEAFHLWDHLTFRYDNIYLTEMYKDLIHDKDFKILLDVSLQRVLKKQETSLEKECLHFGIPLPKKPAEVIAWPADTKHFINDDFIYRNLFFGIIGATLIHAAAVKQSLTNDRIRKYFIDLLISEIKIQDDFIKYGNLKGYLNNVPQYRLG